MRLIDAEELQSLFNEVSTDILSKPNLAKDAEHIMGWRMALLARIYHPLDAVTRAAEGRKR